MDFHPNTPIDISFEWDNVFNSLSDMAMILDTKNTILAVNSIIEKIIGRSQEELIGMKCYDIFHCNNAIPDECPGKKTLVTRRAETMDVEMDACGGIFMVSVYPIVGREGDLKGSIHVAKDITLRKKDEEALRKKNRVLASLRECHQSIVRVHDEMALLHRLCEILVRMGGYRLAWIGYPQMDAGKTVSPVAYYGVEKGYTEGVHISWGDNSHGRWPAGTAIRTRKVVTCNDIGTSSFYTPWVKEVEARGCRSSIAIPLNHADRSIGVLNLYSAEINAFDDMATNLLMELADDLTFGITALRTEKAHKEAEQARIASEKRYRMLIETASDAIITADAETGSIIDANKAAEQLIGLPVDQIMGMHYSKLFPVSERNYYMEMIAKHLESGKINNVDIYVANRKGRNIPVQVNANLLKVNGMQLIQAIARDITEMKHVEKQLRQAQKMEAIGTLAGGIAHDFNNILSPILGYTELALLETEEESQMHADLKEVLLAARRAKGLVQQILTFSRKDQDESAPLKLQPLIKESLSFLRSSIPATIAFKMHIDPGCGHVLCNPTQIHQILMNLCTNAYQAIPEDGGTVEIILKPVNKDILKPDISLSLGVGDYILLSVRDSGEGISEEHLERIFDPYFTTKDKDKGTGLGLAVVHGIVEALNGHIWVTSDPVNGTVFDIYLPVSDPDVYEEIIPADLALPLGKERILFVDDDDQVTHITERMLMNLGYQVTSISHSPEALSLFAGSPDAFDILITDQAMPTLPGTELIKRIHQIRLDLPVIMCTGYSTKVDFDNIKDFGICALLMKPVNRIELARTIREVLDAQGANA